MQIEASIIQALKQVDIPLPDRKIILADRDGVEPKAPYLIIQIINTTNTGLPRRSVTHEEGILTESIFQTKDFDIALTFHATPYNDETHDWVQYFHSGVFSDMVDWAFTQQGLGLVSCDDIMYQSQPVNGRNYKRAILNMTLRAEVLNEYRVNSVKGVEAVGDITSTTGEVVVDMLFGN